MSGRHLLIVVMLATLCLVPAAPGLAAGEVVCVFDRDYPPFSFLENGKPTGFEIELLRAATKQAGAKLHLRPLPWGQAQGQVAVGHAQIIAGLSPTPERQRLYIFLEPPNAVANSVIIARKGSNQIDQLKARPGVEIVGFDSEALALQGPGRGQGGGRRRHGHHRPPLQSEPLHFALCPSQEDLAQRLEAALQSLRASGEYDRLRQRWLEQ